VTNNIEIEELMATDRKIAERVQDLQSRARDYGLLEIPGYMVWSERKLSDGESEALIAHLDATNMWLLPEEIDTVGVAEFEELLADLKIQIGET
jgi:hypothetical protein